MGFEIPDLHVGAVFGVDLILIPHADIEIGSGIHIKFDDGVSFDMQLFDKDLAKTTMEASSRS